VNKIVVLKRINSLSSARDEVWIINAFQAKVAIFKDTQNSLKED